MTKSNTIQGKAFEYAVLDAFRKKLEAHSANVAVDVSDAYNTARESFDVLSESEKRDYIAAASAGAEIVIPLEPRLNSPDALLKLRMQTDARGQRGDVRDVICIRAKDGWEIGFSCKHNHEALKHPRVTESGDFGSDWVGIPCSTQFRQRMASALGPVGQWCEHGDTWQQHSDILHDEVYIPILKAFADEIGRLCSEHKEAPSRLLGYFFGVEDFYKIIAKDRRASGDAGLTKVMAFNVNGTLGQANCGKRPLHPVRRIKMPSRLIDIGIKPGSKTTILITFDENWTVSMRLHSADSRVKKTGLKWDIQLKGMPSDMYQREQPWQCFSPFS